MTSILVDLGLSVKIAKICIQRKYPAIQYVAVLIEIKHYSIAYFRSHYHVRSAEVQNFR